MPGKLTIVMGPMFAGKTTELQRRVKREIYACRTVCVIKYQKDVRYSHSSVSTHDKTLLKATFACDRLCEVPEAEWRQYDMIAIDEGQFFPDLVTFCSTVADAGKSVLVVALDGDFLRRPFGQVCQLIPMAEEVVKITAVCMSCHTRDASFTRRTVTSNATELIGGADMYIAVCRDCYNHPHPPTPGRINAYRTAVRECEQVMHPRAVSASVPAVESTPAATTTAAATVARTPSLAPASPLQLRTLNASAGIAGAASPAVKPTLLPPALPSMAGARRERDEVSAAVVDLPMPLI